MDMSDHFCARLFVLYAVETGSRVKNWLLVHFLAGFADIVINNARSVLIISGTSSVVLIALAFSNSLD